MPNNKSASKRLKQSVTCRQRNRAQKSSIKTQMRKVVAATDAGEIETAESEFRVAAKKLDQAGASGVIHRNQAARHKSRLQKRIKAAKAG